MRSNAEFYYVGENPTYKYWAAVTYGFKMVLRPTAAATLGFTVAENSFMLTTYVSPFKANTSANWNAVFRQTKRLQNNQQCVPPA